MSDYKAMHQIQFRLGICPRPPDPAGGARSIPQLNLGALLLREKGKGKREGEGAGIGEGGKENGMGRNGRPTRF